MHHQGEKVHFLPEKSSEEDVPPPGAVVQHHGVQEKSTGRAGRSIWDEDGEATLVEGNLVRNCLGIFLPLT